MLDWEHKALLRMRQVACSPDMPHSSHMVELIRVVGMGVCYMKQADIGGSWKAVGLLSRLVFPKSEQP